MATGVISVHGHGIRVNTSPQLSLEYRSSASRVENLTTQTITPIVYFPLPSPQKETPNLSTITIAFAGGDVTVTSVALYVGGVTLFTDQVSENSSFTHDIPTSVNAKYTNKGISVGLGLDIPSRKYFDFKSVSITTFGA